jgi:hypothetical protein
MEFFRRQEWNPALHFFVGRLSIITDNGRNGIPLAGDMPSRQEGYVGRLSIAADVGRYRNPFRELIPIGTRLPY